MAGEWWGRGIGPSSDSVITRTDYLTVARLRAQWRRPTRSVIRVSPKKLLTRQPRTGTIYEPGPVAFRGDTHTRRARDSNANFERRSGPRGYAARYVGATWIVFRDRRLVQELYRPSPPSPRFSRICCACAPPFFSLAWVKGPFFRTSGYTATTRWPRELNSRSLVA